MSEIVLKPKAARKLVLDALVGAGARRDNVEFLADGIIDTELSGLSGHGFYWLQFYCAHLESGKVDGRVTPLIKRLSPVAFRADARHGFAHPAIERGFAKLVPAALKYGIAGLAVHNSYNAATLGYHTGHLARHGLLAFGFTNSTPAIAPVGGRTPVIGTNPLSFAVPARNGRIAFLVDQSSSAVAWTAVKRAAEEKRSIPLGWALDSEGRPTTDPEQGLEGSMAPSGGYKGFGQGLIVETMCAALSGALLGTEMGSFTANDGRPIDCGQFFIALNPQIFSGGQFDKQVRALVRSILAQEGARLPNARREASRKNLARTGLTLSRDLYDTIRAYADRAPGSAVDRPLSKRRRGV
ncbi:MAG TPA: Ldh family oxidoreductase [Aestuariivirgaceae bacterium]|jgi:(2R)-3-sulfolactate dehydrogenase (NADP+)|nr:Ldh family oxidoreductase [Aestuariivirgaceae bacterium]